MDIVQLVEQLYVAQYAPCSNQGIHLLFNIYLYSQNSLTG